ncbi:MAG: hypothetical protein DI584_11345 [Stenotrophomonas sp.]|nr:MAG: hypothetical protein DI584_11345 [Stenotrophomonas sp.]
MPLEGDAVVVGFGLWALGFGLWALGFGLWALGFALTPSFPRRRESLLLLLFAVALSKAKAEAEARARAIPAYAGMTAKNQRHKSRSESCLKAPCNAPKAPRTAEQSCAPGCGHC